MNLTKGQTKGYEKKSRMVKKLKISVTRKLIKMERILYSFIDVIVYY